jgi:hypothetical protein
MLSGGELRIAKFPRSRSILLEEAVDWVGMFDFAETPHKRAVLLRSE